MSNTTNNRCLNCCCGSNCTCGDDCRCTEICCCEASSVLQSLGSTTTSVDAAALPVLVVDASAASPCHEPQSQVVVVLLVHGMHCQSCVKTITAALSDCDHVANVAVDLKQETVTVTMKRSCSTTTMDEATIKEEAKAMRDTIENVGFEATLSEIKNTVTRDQPDAGEHNDIEQPNQQSPLFSPPAEIPDELQLPAKGATASEMTTTTQQVDLVISGMTCSMCTNAIRSALQSKEGVESVRVSLATDTATVDYQPSTNLSIAQLVEEIESVGYTVTEIIEPQDDGNNEHNLERLEQSQQAQVLQKKRAFLFSLVGTVPIFFLTMILPHLQLHGIQSWLDAPFRLFQFTMTRESFILWILATPVQFGSGYTFYRGAWFGLQSGVLGMDVLVAMGTTASYGYALEDTLFGRSGGSGAHFFETSVVLISFVLLGKWMNALAVRRTSHALSQLLQLQSKTALRVTPVDGSLTSTNKDWDPTTTAYREEVVDIQQVHPGDVLKIKRGASIPADGILYKGEMTVDQSMITGESIPVLKSPGSVVLGGTVCVETSECFISVTGVGSSTALSQIVSLVREAQTRQVPIQDLADKISAVFVPTVVTLSVITFIVWYALCNTGVVPAEWLSNESAATFSLEFALACIVVSCPCALGLATPTAVMVGTGVGAKNGILYKGGDSLERASCINSIVFDKTGTLTQGKPCITDFVSVTHMNDQSDAQSNHCANSTISSENDTDRKSRCCSKESSAKQTQDMQANRGILMDRNYVLWLLGSLERNSEHPLASAVVSYAESNMDQEYLESHPFAQPSEFRALTGRGASGVIDGNVSVAVGNRPFCQTMNLSIPPQVSAEMARLEQDGKTAILAAINGRVRFVLGIADELKPDAAASIAYLQDELNIDVWMVTGDNSRTARAISRRLHLNPDRVIAEALPVAKVRQVRNLQAQGRVVAMVGDGINDSPALAQANVGISLGTGAEIAAEASDMVLVKANVADVCTALDLSRVIFRRIKLNFMWSLLYNCCGIPVAAGVFYPLTRTRLPPTLAALAMALSSLSVVGSSLALRLYRPPHVDAQGGASAQPQRGCQRLFRRTTRQIRRLVPNGSVSPNVPLDETNDMMQSLLANDHTAGSTTQIDNKLDDSKAGRMEEGHT